MLCDAQGHELSGATREAIGHFDRAVRAFTLVYGDVLGFYDRALAVAPHLVMAHLGKAWALSLGNDPMLAAKARTLLDAARAHPRNEREEAHYSALAEAVEGHRAAAVAILNQHLMDCPLIWSRTWRPCRWTVISDAFIWPATDRR